ncbi:hypothetical protein U1839_10815 [Sphingomonas sp. RT2P30]|uniref:hypothetical protein n=1 Tax=Parasphingomonas halimpatiens TaxID=3096162 RepID=UPI002FC6EA10
MTSRAGGKRATDLFRYDATIIRNEAHAAFPNWTDRLLGLVLLVVALAVARAALGDRAFIVAAVAVATLAFLVGAATARLIERRLAFHAYDGVLAADALIPASRRHYALAGHAVALAGTALATLVARPTLLAIAIAGYLVGATIRHLGSFLAQRFATPQFAGLRPFDSRALWCWLEQPLAGAAGAIPLLLILVATARDEAAAAPVLAALVTAITALALTALDDGVVRFMTLSGHPAWAIIARRARATLVFTLLAVPICLATATPLVAGLVGVVAAASLLLMATRILAYRIHARRTADLVVGGCAMVVIVTGAAMPMLLPFVAAAILWQLSRRAGAMTWLLR